MEADFLIYRCDIRSLGSNLVSFNSSKVTKCHEKLLAVWIIQVVGQGHKHGARTLQSRDASMRSRDDLQRSRDDLQRLRDDLQRSRDAVI